MTTQATTNRQVRVFLLAVMLFLASTLFGTGAAMADVLNPKVDMGGPGGGGGGAAETVEVADSKVPGIRES